MGHSEDIINELNQRLGTDFEFKAGTKIYWFYTNRERVREIAKYLTGEFKARVIHVSVIDRGLNGYEVIYHYSLDHLDQYVHFNVKVQLPPEEPEIESISDIAPEASWSEREMMEFTPVRFIDHPDPRHLWLPYEWPNAVESEKCDHFVDKNGKLPFAADTAQKLERSLIPLGPYHPLLIEGAYFRVKLNGETITDVDVKLGWNHRGIMKLFEGRSYSRGVFLAERVCGICNVTHTTAYLNAVETLGGIEIPDRARYIRTLMAELERIHSHLLWLGVAGDLIGFKTLFMLSLKAREQVLDIFESLTGSRRAPAMNLIGGIRKDVKGEVITKTNRRLQTMKKETAKLIEIVYNHPLTRKRLQDIGKLDLFTAKNAGAVGPTARASGWKLDIRQSSPYAAYGPEYTTWDIVTDEGGDVWSRTIVRLKEILVSADILVQCLKALDNTTGPISIEAADPKNFKFNEALGKAEAPRGELVYYVVSDGSNIPYSVRIRTPSFRNNALLPKLLRGHTLADAPIIIGSIDPCYACTDRIFTITDSGAKKNSSVATSSQFTWSQ
ncbi:NADH-quinone oxidoreductase subunit C [Candidatus Bathyarchaeota archaeon]|nr:NADH-quinone oxidoreductase subunit C [Candidatus Bathyarchaeota archaeon]